MAPSKDTKAGGAKRNAGVMNVERGTGCRRVWFPAEDIGPCPRWNGRYFYRALLSQEMNK